MRSWLTRVVVGTVAVASVATVPLALASPQQHHATKHRVVHAKRATDTTASENAGETAGENAGETPGGESAGGESVNDSARQSSACRTARVDPGGSNVQYDDQTGTCTANDGGGGGSQTQQ